MTVLDDPGGPSVIRSVLLRGRQGRFSHWNHMATSQGMPKECLVTFRSLERQRNRSQESLHKELPRVFVLVDSRA